MSNLTREELEVIADKYRSVDSDDICQIYNRVQPKFKVGDCIQLNSKESPILTIQRHIEELWMLAYVPSFNGNYLAEYFTNTIRKNASGTSVEALEAYTIEIHQDMYKLVEIED